MTHRWPALVLSLSLVTVLLVPASGRVGDVAATDTPAAGSPAALPGPPPGLDRTGRTIPVTAYPIPAGAVFMAPNGSDEADGSRRAPVRTLNRAIDLARDGGTVVLRGGEYRDWYHRRAGTRPGIVDKSLTFQAYPREAPWLDGADVIATDRWRKVEGQQLWSLPWDTPQFCDDQYYDRPLSAQSEDPNTGPCAHFDMSDNPSNPMANDPQMVFLNGVALKQRPAGSRLDLASFSYDWETRRLYLGVDPAGWTVEAAVRPTALVLGGGHAYVVRGIGFRRYATNQYHNGTSAALYFGNAVGRVEHSVFAHNAAGALSMSKPRPGSVVRRSVFAENGYTALGANGDSQTGRRNDLVVDGNVLARNNQEGFGESCTISCGQAAAKFAHMVGLTLSRNRVAGTGGRASGLWCDLDCSDVRYLYNIVSGNANSGIFHEVSDTGVIAANVLTGNGYGISVASANTKIYHNTLVDNVQCINVYDDARSRGFDGWADLGPDTRDVEVVNNVVSGRNYSIIGSAATRGPAANPEVTELFARLDANTLHQSNGPEPIFVYLRDRSGAEAFFRDRERFVAVHGAEQRSQWITGSADPLFVERPAGDYRIRPDSVAFGAALPLPADVAAALDVPAASRTRSRGAFAAP